ncbi:MAG: glycosyltransferase [Deltaproteobacteria bacterium]|nr:glycosyltransferase [Deltaproteobacteria bacterium]
MKILFSGHHNPHFFTITEYQESAIRSLGHELVVFEDRQHRIPGRLRKRFNFLHRIDQKIISRQLLSLVWATMPDIVIVQGGYRELPDTLKRLKKFGTKTILWTTDAPISFQVIIETAPLYDYIFCLGTEAIELLDRAGIKGAQWLPMACDPDYHHPVKCTPDELKKFGSDVVFVGSYYPERATLFERLLVLNSCELAIWGPGWNALPAASPLRKHIRGLHIRPEEWLKIYSAGKIVLSAHYHDPQGVIPVYQASPRVFEIMACGAFQLCDDQRDVFALFKDGQDLVKFSDGKDLVAKVKYYLDHPEERKAIASQGRKTVLARHTYRDRVRELLAKIGHDV